MKLVKRLQPKWAEALVAIGLFLFAAACVHGGRPEWTIFVGPAVMLSGILLLIAQGS